MLFIGLLIAGAAAVFAVVLLIEDWGGATYTIHGFGHVLGSLTLAEIFLSGIILTAIFFTALWLASVSNMMRRRASQRRRAENRAIREEHENVLFERDRLARELEAERAAHGEPSTYPTSSDVYRQPGDGYVAPPADARSVDEEARRHTV